ncbi:MAG: hypothetical protein AMJ69_06490, partial [Gammaproteobacteria bacterium SG8_47]
MGGIFFTLFAFLLAITVLIAVHEFGHFWVAKRLGVKVLRYSVGFGRPLWRRRFGVDHTEYVVAAIPLGGYVKMLDEREGPVAPEELHRAFNRQKVAKRFAIVFAGPLFNFLFAIIAYWAVFVVGVTGVKPVVGEVVPDSLAAEAGLRAGQHILAVDGVATPIWDVALQAMLPKLLDREPLTLEVAESDVGPRQRLVMDLSRTPFDFEPTDLLLTLGLKPWRPPIDAVVGTVHADTPAQRAGVQEGDRILAVDGQSIDDWQQLVDSVQSGSGDPLQLRIE